MSDFLERIKNLSPKRLALLAMELQSKLEKLEQTANEPIAIIGLGCRFPGAENPQAFWQMLREGRDVIREVPKERWDIDAYYDPNPDALGKMNTRFGGFLEGIDRFDPLFFGISLREAISMDPQQRLLLEVTWEALEHAGIASEKIEGSLTGVFLGICSTDYAQLLQGQGQQAFDAYIATGSSHAIASGRLSYVLGVHGPSLSLDTACSSSLVAVHQACLNLRERACNMAIAGGVNVIASPNTSVALSKAHMMSPEGRCKTFDASADGFVRGEGCGIVVLKRLRDAIAEGDNVLALIVGSAVNQDGRSSGITAPNGPAQEAVIRAALDMAKLTPNEIQYVETHGTGTALGDPIEVNALGAVFRKAHSASRPLQIGSVKTNFGHLEGAAGIAGLIKLVLALQHKQIPPHLHLNKRNPYIPWEDYPFAIPTALTPWEEVNGKRIGATSSFGFSGTNAHVVVQGAKEENEEKEPSSSLLRPAHVLALSAKSAEALRELAVRYTTHLNLIDEHASDNSTLEGGVTQNLANICFTANTGRSHFSHRLAVLAQTSQQMQEQLRAFAAGDTPSDLLHRELPNSKRSEVVFLFTGQGAQYLDMGRRLYETQPTFRKVLDRCDEILRPYLKASLLEVLFENQQTAPASNPVILEGTSLTLGANSSSREGSFRMTKRLEGTNAQSSLSPDRRSLITDHWQQNTEHLLHQTAFTQPALFAIEYALAELWRSWGVAPAAVMGHSVGEYVAACVAGVFSLEDGLRLIAERGRLMQALPRETRGVMVAVFAREEKVAAAISSSPVAIAAINGPENVVISGEQNAVEEVVRELANEGITSKALNVSHAFHSPLMLPMLDEFAQVLNTITFHAPKIPFISNLTAQPIHFAPCDTEPPASSIQHQASSHDPRLYFCRHVREAVRFSSSIEWLHQQGYKIFMELGPSPTLLSMAAKCLPEGAMIAVPSLRKGKDDWQQMLHSLATLYTHNVAIDWSGFDRDYARRRVVLPTYPFQRERFWIEEAKIMGRGSLLVNRDHQSTIHYPRSTSKHPLLGHKFHGPLPIFETQLGLTELAMMDQHRAHGVAVVPGVVYLEMALAAAAEVLGEQHCVLEDVVLHAALTLPEEGSRAVQLILTPEAEHFIFQFYSNDVEQHDAWRLHASGKMRRAKGEEQKTEREEQNTLSEIQMRCVASSVAELIEKVRARGIQVTEHAQHLAQLWQGEGEALGLIDLNSFVRAQTSVYQIPPAVLDTALQVLEAALPRDNATANALYMLMGVARVEFFARPRARVWVHGVKLESAHNDGAVLKGEAVLLDESGAPLAKLIGLQFKRVAPEAQLHSPFESLNEWLYEVQWREQARANASQNFTAQYFPVLAEIAHDMQPNMTALYAENNLQLYDDLLPRLDALCGAYVAQALRQLGFLFQVGEQFTHEELRTRLQVQTRHHRLFERMLLMLTQDGVLARHEDFWRVQSTPPSQDCAHAMSELLTLYPACKAELALTQRCGEGLAGALRGTLDPLQLLFPAGSLADTEQLYQEAPVSKAFNLILRDAIASALRNLPRERKLRVLEIGGGTGGTTTRVLPILPAERTEYVFTDIGQLFTTRAAEKFKNCPFVRYQVLDISAELEPQGFALHEFDLIIAANVLHATSDLRHTLRNVQKLLAAQGLLVLLEGSVPQRFGDLTVGLTEGWWSYTDRDLRPDYALLAENKWLELLASMNFSEAIALPQGGERKGVLQTQAVILARGPSVIPPLRGVSLAASSTEKHTPLKGGIKKAASSHERASWLLLADESGVAQVLAQMLEAQGEDCVLVHATADHAFRVDPSQPEDCKRVLHEAFTSQAMSCRGVINLWPLDAATEPATLDELREIQMQLVGGALHLVQALAANEKLKASRLWIITRNAQAVGEQQTTLAQSPLWGLGKVIAMEHPELHCTRIDLDTTHVEEAARLLFDEIQNADDEDQIAFRNGARYVPRLVQSSVKIVERGSWIVDREKPSLQNNLQPTIHDPQSTILITGGLAGLGLLVAQWLVEHGARHLVLLGRSAPNQHALAAVREMESLGAQIIIEQADVADAARMADLFSRFEQTMPALRGVIHSAGAIDDGVLLQQDWSRFEKVMRAKVFGTWNLHKLTERHALDFFVLFSTGAALIGSAGQGNHAAANMFMDMLAHHRRARGLPALSINWGAWSEVGTVIRHQQSERFTIGGKRVIAPAQGLKIFERLLHASSAQVGVLPIDWFEALDEMGERKNFPFFAELLREVKQQRGSKMKDGGSRIKQSASSNQHPATFISQLNAAPKSQRWSRLQTFVREQALKVLGLAATRAISLQRPLTELGLDSLMAVELRNALGKGVEQTLPATLLFDHPTIDELVNHLGKNVLALESAVIEAETSLTNGNASLSEKEAELDELSEEEMAALLEERLG